jgi:hypothetical protein
MSAYCHRNMRMTISILLLSFLLLIAAMFFTLSHIHAGVVQSPQVTIYQCYTSDALTIAWENPDSLLAEYYFWNIGEQKKYRSNTTIGTQITVKLPRTGLYSFYIRFKLPDSTYTAWTNSMEDDFCQIIPIGQTNYAPGAWIIYGHIAPPSL